MARRGSQGHPTPNNWKSLDLNIFKDDDARMIFQALFSEQYDNSVKKADREIFYTPPPPF